MIEKVIKKENQERLTKAELPSEIMAPNKVMLENKDKVLKLRKQGMSMEKISKETGVGYGTIQKICKLN